MFFFFVVVVVDDAAVLDFDKFHSLGTIFIEEKDKELGEGGEEPV